ncbi:MAG TPA: hypothetical protein VF753_08460 [Terriglobales bacterium]
MTEVLNGDAVEVEEQSLHDAPKLLIEWPSAWDEFWSSIRPAMSKSADPLGGEAPVGMFPYRGMIATWLGEAALLFLLIFVPMKLASIKPYMPTATPKWDVIYYSGEELPQTEDVGGARAGKSGRSGGHEARTRTQTIRVARGESLKEKIVEAPKLNLPHSDSAVANLLAFTHDPGPAPAEGLKPTLRLPSAGQGVVAPAPEVHPNNLRSVPALSASVVPPPPDIQRGNTRQQPAVSPTVVPPSPSAPQRDPFSARLPGSQAVQVVAPPVSAPEQITNLHPTLTLPVTVVAPPPTAEVVRDLKAAGPGYGSGDLQRQVVPPPVQISGTSSNPRSAGYGNASDSVVPPPVQLKGSATATRAIAGSGVSDKIVPPPVQIGDSAASGNSKSGRKIGGPTGAGTVVPPAPSMGSGSGQGSLQGRQMAGLAASGSDGVVAPAPSLTGDSSLSGLGRGNRGAGLGGPLDAGSVSAPPSTTGGSASGHGLVVSNQPGSKVGIPNGGGAGSIAMSPTGGDKPGLGGAGGGTGLGKGTGSGSGLSGAGPGATKTGTGHGSDVAANSGISPYPGPGGAGNGSISKAPVPGISVHGGSSNIITLPSFGADGSAPSATGSGRSMAPKKNEGPAITIVGSPRSGGALNLYGKLKGDKVYTIYIDTTLGTAILEYADPTSTAHPYGEDLIAPQPMRADLPANLKPSRLLIACVLDRSGVIKDARVLEGSESGLSAKVLASLPNWKFRPVFRGDQAIDVDAILGFAIDTR